MCSCLGRDLGKCKWQMDGERRKEAPRLLQMSKKDHSLNEDRAATDRIMGKTGKWPGMSAVKCVCYCMEQFADYSQFCEHRVSITLSGAASKFLYAIEFCALR